MYDNSEDNYYYNLMEKEMIDELTPSRYHSSENFPTVPIEPDALILNVTQQLVAFGNVVPAKTPQMILELCKGFNECIRRNQNKEEPRILIYSPPTGSAKSLSAKTYVSLLKNETSLIVVNRVDDAIEFCRDINVLRGNQEYAKCYYRITDENNNSVYRATKESLGELKCLVITKSMLKTLTMYSKSELAEIILSVQRDLVIVDERLQLFTTNILRNKELSDCITMFESINAVTQHKIGIDLTTLKGIEKIFTSYNAQASIEKKLHLWDKPEEVKDLQFTNLQLQFQQINKLLDANDINLLLHISSLIDRRSDVTNENVKENIRMLLETIGSIFSENEYLFTKSGDISTLSVVNNLDNRFGSMIVLDATAAINQYYDTLTYCKHAAAWHIASIDPRTYKNLTIHKARGFNQGKTSLYEGLTGAEVNRNLDYYLATANSILTPNDKLLIIAHKTFREMLEAKNIDPRIEFTHWGNHIGKNNWSHCNKVMIIGWHRIPQNAHYLNFTSAVGSFQEARESIQVNDSLNVYNLTQLVDDLIQGTMRCSARKTIDTEGNCTVSDIYIFYANNKHDVAVVDLYEKYFRDAIVTKWIPPLVGIEQNLGKRAKDIDGVMQYLLIKSKTSENILWKNVIIDLELTAVKASRILNDQSFMEAVFDQCWTIGFHAGSKKSKVIYF